MTTDNLPQMDRGNKIAHRHAPVSAAETPSGDDTLRAWLSHWAAKQPGHVALQCGDTVYDYAQLAQVVASTASGLQQRGVAKGDVVAVQLPNIPEFLIAYLAITSIGAIMQPLHMPYRTVDLEYLLSSSRARAYIGMARIRDFESARTVSELCKSLTNLKLVIAVDDCDYAVPFAALARDGREAEVPKLGSTDPYLLAYTSGTTSRPKGVPHSYAGFLGNARDAAGEFAIQRRDRLMSAAAATHLYGLFAYHVTLAAGATAVLLPAFEPEALLSAAADQAVTGIFCAPAHMAPIVGDPRARRALATVRFVCMSGAAVPARIADGVDAVLVNGKALQLWGMSELQAGSYTRPEDPPEVRRYTAGRASPGTRLRVTGERGEILGPGREGELQVRGPSVFSGYLENPEETRKAFTDDGWFRTGDLAVISEDGVLVITGRIKELINRGGVKYNPLEVEAHIEGMPEVAACAIVPYADPVLGERACVFVMPEAGDRVDLERITQVLDAAQVAKYKWPERIELVAEMPLTPTRKIIRGELRRILARRASDQ